MWARGHGNGNKSTNLFFEGDIIYSYGCHAPLARRVNSALFLVTTKKWTKTTSTKHMPAVYRAIAALSYDIIYHVHDVTANDPSAHADNYEAMLAEVENTLNKAGRSRLRENYVWRLQDAQQLLINAGNYAADFDVQSHTTRAEKLRVDVRLRLAAASKAG